MDAPEIDRFALGILGASPVFEGLSRGQVERLAGFLGLRRCAPESLVVLQGEATRSLFVVVRGEASVRADGVEVGRALAGDCFGELALLAETPRAATVVALTRLDVVELTGDAFDRLCEVDPALALALTRALVGRLRGRLSEMTERVSVFLRERSLPRRVSVAVRMAGETRRVRTATPACELLPAEVEGRPVVAALLDRRPVSLRTPISVDCALEPLTTAHWEGQRIWQRSLLLLVLEAAHAVDPSLAVRVGPAVGFGQRLLVDANGGGRGLAALADALQAALVRLADEDLPLHEEWWAVDEARAHFASRAWTSAAELLKYWVEPMVLLQSWGEVQAAAFGPLVPRSGLLGGGQIVAEEGGLLLLFGRAGTTRERITAWPGEVRAAAQARAASQHADAMTQEHVRWLAALDITSVGAFNRACIDGKVDELVRVAEGFHEKRFSAIADLVRARRPGVRVVCVAGPSSSGKTTFIRRLKVQLQVNGLRPVGLSLDDYYCNREATPRGEDGEYDYEALAALRLDMLGDHLRRLLTGERVATPRYDFKAGRSLEGEGASLAVGENDVLLLEGIHALNPELTRAVPDDAVFRAFICPLAQLPFDRLSRVHASDLRLVRRIVRDRHGRGISAASNIRRWPSVRRGERAHIFPFQGQADAVFDSSLLYELSVLRVFAERYLLEVPHDDEAYTTAHRLLLLVTRFVTIYPDHVPPTSILREFIGGSGFEY